jgi:hypothetical protein
MNVIKLLAYLDQYFSLDDLETLCFLLGVDFDNLGGIGKKGKARELIEYLDKRGRLDALITAMQQERPQLDFSDLLPKPEPPVTQDAPPNRETMRQRPAAGGDSISNYRGGAATLGCLVVGRAAPRQLYLLCDASGLAATFESQIGDPILQPGQSDGGLPALDTIATLNRWTQPNADNSLANDNLSAAIAQVKNLSDLSPEIRGRGIPKGVRPPVVGVSVTGVGRTSGPAQGTILATEATESVPWPISQVIAPQSTGDGSGYYPVLFGDLIVCTAMIDAGDSGMVLLDDDNYAIGLAFAGSDQYSLFIPLQKVLDRFEVDLVTVEVWQSLNVIR